MIYSITYIIPALVYVGVLLGGYATFSAIFFVVVIHSCLELVFHKYIGLKYSLPNGPSFTVKLILYLYPFVQTAVLVSVLVCVGTQELSLVEYTGLVLSTGCMTGAMGITVAHELVHKPSQVARTLGLFLLWQVLYMQFHLEHLFNHHKYVGTERDSSTARKGQSLFSFVPRSIIGSFKNAYWVESQIHPNILRNRFYIYLFLEILGVSLMFAAFGTSLLVFFVLQALVAITFLESVQYIEHYGIKRKELSPGVYEKINPSHSWDTYHFLTNSYLFKLGYHSDHHLDPSKNYYDLEDTHTRYVLPGGVSAMIILAFIPPLWRQVIDHRIP